MSGRAGERASLPVDADRFRRNAANARGNVAAIILDRHGIQRPYDPATLPAAVKQELRDLAEALGVAGTGRRPGYCACGAELPVTASHGSTGQYIRDHCYVCSTRGDR